MTSASELFWRSRAGRAPEPELGLDPLSSDRDHDLRRPRRRRAHRRLLQRDDSDPGRRPHSGFPPVRHLCHRVSPTEREFAQLDNNGASESGTSNSRIGIAASSRVHRLRLSRNDRLPGAVLQARARLLERLRGISLTGSRQTTTSGIPWDEFAVGDDFRAIDSGDWENEEWVESTTPSTDLDVEGNLASHLRGASRKSPGLTREAVCSLQQEIFREAEASDVIGASLECCICLEMFWQGDELIRLHCEHRFHASCLEPWVQNCGDCPYCRASI